MSGLDIAPGLDLPSGVVTQSIAILARRGAGKTYTASVFVEEVIGAQVPVVILDPTGAWWGLRTSADGEKPGLPVVVFGGEHGNVPLEPTVGKTIADVVIEHPGAYVIDLSAFESKANEVQFAADFLERLYRAKRRETGPLLLVVDEADMFAPQRSMDKGNQLRTLGALEAIVRRGRIKGLGDLLITQRAAVLNKNVLTQTEVLIVMQTTGPQDRLAIEEWIAGNGTREERDTVIDSLAALDRGEAWVWSPSFLRILQRVRIRERRTFDSSRTPEAGEAAIIPRAFAEVDLEQLDARIKASIEQGKANDPAELRRKINTLERELRDRPEPERIIERIEVPVLNGEVARLDQLVSALRPLVDLLGEASSGITAGAAEMRALGSDILTAVGRAAAPVTVAPRPIAPPRPVVAVPTAPRPVPQTDGSVVLGKAERLILAALAQYPAGRTKVQVALLAGYAHSGGGFNNAISALRARGLVEGGKERMVITPDGLAAIGNDWTPLPTGRALLEHWLPQLGKAERMIVTALADTYPNALTKADLGAATGYEPSGGGFNNALSRLRTLELIDRGTNPRLSDDLS